jgi:hypothetical protein
MRVNAFDKISTIIVHPFANPAMDFKLRQSTTTYTGKESQEARIIPHL